MRELRLAIALTLLLAPGQAILAQAPEAPAPDLPLLQAADLHKEALAHFPESYFLTRKMALESLEAKPDYLPSLFLMAKSSFVRGQEKDLELEQLTRNRSRAALLEEARQKASEAYAEALEYFDLVLAYDPSFNRWESHYLLGKYHYQKRQYELASQYLETFVENNRFDCEWVEDAQRMIVDTRTFFDLILNRVPFDPKPLPGVCTEHHEYLPLLSRDQEWIYYTQRKESTSDGRRGFYDETAEIFTFSRLSSPFTEPPTYTLGQPMPSPPFNDGRNQGAASLSIENQTLYLTICEPQRHGLTSFMDCDLYVTHREGDAWGRLRSLPAAVNGMNSWESQPSISADGKVLFFVSDRAGGYGGTDIYFATLDSLGNWSNAINIGLPINTPDDERTPFIHTDGQTLYYSTDGRFGMGGFDVYFTKYMGGGEWSEPVNLGYPINTEQDEFGFIISTSGEEVFLTSALFNQTLNYDILHAQLHEKARPGRVLFVKGELRDEEGNPIRNATVELENITTLTLTRGIFDPNTGRYAMAVNVEEGDEFVITAKTPGMYFDSHYIDPFQPRFDYPNSLDFELRHIRVGATFRLKDVYFETNSAELDQTSRVTLDNFVEFLNLNPSLVIELRGHTDDVGDYTSNMELSINRAKAVQDYLIAHGIQPERLSYRGFGESQLLIPETTPEARAINRRTEFVVTVR